MGSFLNNRDIQESKARSSMALPQLSSASHPPALSTRKSHPSTECIAETTRSRRLGKEQDQKVGGGAATLLFITIGLRGDDTSC